MFWLIFQTIKKYEVNFTLFVNRNCGVEIRAYNTEHHRMSVYADIGRLYCAMFACDTIRASLPISRQKLTWNRPVSWPQASVSKQPTYIMHYTNS